METCVHEGLSFVLYRHSENLISIVSPQIEPFAELCYVQVAMPSRLTLLAILAGLLAVLFSPQLASEAINQGCLVKAPPNFTRDKVFDYDFVRSLQVPKVHGPLDAMLFTRDGHKMSAALAKKGDRIELRSSGPRRTAEVLVHTTSQFVYREDFGYGQCIVHTLNFAPTKTGEYKTNFEYETRWKGSFALMLLGKAGFTKPLGLDVGSTEDLRLALEDAYEDEKIKWGTARYN